MVGLSVGHLLFTALAYVWRAFSCNAALPGTSNDVIATVGGFLSFSLAGCGSGMPEWVGFIAFLIIPFPWILAVTYLVFLVVQGFAGSLAGSLVAIAFIITVAALIGISL